MFWRNYSQEQFRTERDFQLHALMTFSELRVLSTIISLLTYDKCLHCLEYVISTTYCNWKSFEENTYKNNFVPISVTLNCYHLWYFLSLEFGVPIILLMTNGKWMNVWETVKVYLIIFPEMQINKVFKKLHTRTI